MVSVGDPAARHVMCGGMNDDGADNLAGLSDHECGAEYHCLRHDVVCAKDGGGLHCIFYLWSDAEIRFLSTLDQAFWLDRASDGRYRCLHGAWKVVSVDLLLREPLTEFLPRGCEAFLHVFVTLILSLFGCIIHKRRKLFDAL